MGLLAGSAVAVGIAFGTPAFAVPVAQQIEIVMANDSSTGSESNTVVYRRNGATYSTSNTDKYQSALYFDLKTLDFTADNQNDPPDYTPISNAPYNQTVINWFNNIVYPVGHANAGQLVGFENTGVGVTDWSYLEARALASGGEAEGPKLYRWNHGLGVCSSFTDDSTMLNCREGNPQHAMDGKMDVPDTNDDSAEKEGIGFDLVGAPDDYKYTLAYAVFGLADSNDDVRVTYKDINGLAQTVVFDLGDGVCGQAYDKKVGKQDKWAPDDICRIDIDLLGSEFQFWADGNDDEFKFYSVAWEFEVENGIPPEDPEDPPTEIPVPATLLLFGPALFGLHLVRRRRRSA